MDEFQCSLCLRLLYNPCTIPCGHTYCKSCIKKSLSRQRSCPICRQATHLPLNALSTAVLIQSVIAKQLPQELALRIAEEQEDAPRLEIRKLPVMIVQNLLVFPGCTKTLQIIEWRYREMIREAINLHNCFGLLSNFGGVWLGVVLQIKSSQEISLAVYKVETVAVRRFTCRALEYAEGTVSINEADLKMLCCSDYLYSCEPDYINDTEGEAPVQMKELVKDFSQGCMRRLSALERMLIERNVGSVDDLGFYSFCVLNIPESELVRGFLERDPARRLSIVRDFIGNKKPDPQYLRIKNQQRLLMQITHALVVIFILIFFFYDQLSVILEYEGGGRIFERQITDLIRRTRRHTWGEKSVKTRGSASSEKGSSYFKLTLQSANRLYSLGLFQQWAGPAKDDGFPSQQLALY